MRNLVHTPNSIQAVIFDRDDTLLQYNMDVLAEMGTRITEIAPHTTLETLNNYWNAWPGPWPRCEAEEPLFWRSFWAGFAAQQQIEKRAATELPSLSDFYYRCYMAFSDAEPCIGALRGRGIRLAVLTNFDLPSVGVTLRQANLDPQWFVALLSSAALGVYKPDPRAYLAAAAALDLPPQACMFVDDLVENVAAACALGMHGVWLDRHGAAHYTEFPRISSLDSLPTLLAEYGEARNGRDKRGVCPTPHRWSPGSGV
jgi:putative hydrolase of the HAD superfamily